MFRLASIPNHFANIIPSDFLWFSIVRIVRFFIHFLLFFFLLCLPRYTAFYGAVSIAKKKKRISHLRFICSIQKEKWILNRMQTEYSRIDNIQAQNEYDKCEPLDSEEEKKKTKRMRGVEWSVIYWDTEQELFSVEKKLHIYEIIRLENISFYFYSNATFFHIIFLFAHSSSLY